MEPDNRKNSHINKRKAPNSGWGPVDHPGIHLRRAEKSSSVKIGIPSSCACLLYTSNYSVSSSSEQELVFSSPVSMSTSNEPDSIGLVCYSLVIEDNVGYFQLDFNFQTSVVSFESVSYTHLDVYKRQACFGG